MLDKKADLEKLRPLVPPALAALAAALAAGNERAAEGMLVAFVRVSDEAATPPSARLSLCSCFLPSGRTPHHELPHLSSIPT